MNEVKLSTKAELNAELAEDLKAFSGLKLLHVKKQISVILSQIGRDGIFDEYTKHDISHIDYMLKSLEWIIPEKTQEKLTPANWLMLTLSIYFHDLGMLVTKDEFKNRNNSSFPKFKQSIINGEYGLDYKNKIFSLPDSENQDRFIYQELVRKTHAERIKYWILEESNPNFQFDFQIAKEIKTLLSSLDYMFRRDLAIICESHHLSDLEDYEKYKPNQQYGISQKETVNLHYTAIILRTADLLHITSDRTPSIEFNLINPSDPISQEEWAKQSSVKTIRPQQKKNNEGNFDDNIPKDTFEVIALFEEDKGFFGLISYLNYANKQLKENHRFNENANRMFSNEFDYPWKNIDDSLIETKDFEKRQFEFILDQTKILDLLVGHTLYNDSTVVLRELTQNGIDSAKLKKHELDLEGKSENYIPEIKIIWDEESRELTFSDNGTGMNLEIIQNHLLKVGSSRYQDDAFKKKYPDFSPISRFGIGLLTCFLIADDIDILTKVSDTEKAILLKIKKVHGKYLLKYIPSEKIPENIKDHGTEIKLFVRANVDLSNIEQELKKWILIPTCKLSLEINKNIIPIGYSSPADALSTYLKEIGYDLDSENIKVKQESLNGITIAYGLKYIEHWKEWDFLEVSNGELFNDQPIGTCIEGIRVDFNTPGFDGRNIFALANASGKNAPKTNVARSNIEITPEREALLSSIYQLYLQHISNELENLRKIGFSITWAANEANWLLNRFFNQRYSHKQEAAIEDLKSFENAIKSLNCILIEKDSKREIISINDLQKYNHFWSIESGAYTSADSLIKEVKSSNISALALLKTIFGNEDSNINHIDYLICNHRYSPITDKIIKTKFQIDSIILTPEQRRIDLRWSLIKEKIWEEINIDIDDFDYRHSYLNKCFIQLLDFDDTPKISHVAINSNEALFILKGSDLNTYLVEQVKKLANKSTEDQIALNEIVKLVARCFYFKEINSSLIANIFESQFDRKDVRDLAGIVWSRVNKENLISILLKTKFEKYDTTIWSRRNWFL